MHLSEFHYHLPRELIAQRPLSERSSSRLMVLNSNGTEHRMFKDIVDYFEEGDTMVINDTKVFPARIYGRKGTGGKVECLLVKELEENRWECLLRGQRLRVGTEMVFSDNLKGTVAGRSDNKFIVEFSCPGSVMDEVEAIGIMPTPPYIKEDLAEDERYQTVYARNTGSIAAPTAGFHFTDDLLSTLEKKGVNIARITLHVGLGTFLPVKTEDIQDHRMEPEYYTITPESAAIINERKGRLFAVGTTTLKTLESAANGNGKIRAGSAWSDIFIYPPYGFKSGVDGLITNFHLPGSTLIMLVSALASQERIMGAYEEAVDEGYRFYSFGDAMFIMGDGK